MKVTYQDSIFVAQCSFEEKDMAKNAGFRWNPDRRIWWTSQPFTAAELMEYVDDAAREQIELARASVVQSTAAETEIKIEIPLPEGKSLFPYQRAGVEFASNRSAVLIGDEMGLGKGLAHGTGVLTLNGFTPVEKLNVGDYVIGKNGKPTKVIGVYPQGVVKRYKVSFNDKTSVVTDGPHRWAVQHVRNGHRNPELWHVKTTEEIMGDLRDGANNANWKIPIVESIDFGYKTFLPIHPYLLGVLLGDGGIKHRVRFSSNDDEIINTVSNLIPKSLKIKHAKGPDYTIISERAGAENELLRNLKSLGLFGKGSHDKFVPYQYLYSTKQCRLDLLRGLMDTDGHAGKNGISEFSSVSKDLADAVVFIVQSLGGITRRSTKKLNTGSIAHRVNVKLTECPFSISRKVEAWIPPTKYPPSRNIINIEFKDYGPTTCIKVEADDELFVIENCIVTHNTVQAIALINLIAPDTVLILCPATLKLNWQKECNRWLTTPRRVHVLKSGDAFPTLPDIVVMNYDIAAKYQDEIRARYWGLLIADEAHYMKNPKAQRTVAILGKGKKEPGIKAAKKIFLTGTPITNRPVELWPLVNYLFPATFSDFWPFAKRYCNARQNGYGWDFSGASDLEHLQQTLRGAGMLRRLKAQVLTELPAKMRQVILLPSDSVSRLIKQENEHGAELEKRVKSIKAEAKRMKAAGDTAGYADAVKQLRQAYGVAFEEMAAVRKELALAKIPFVIDHLTDLIESGEKVVLMAHHRAVIDQIQNHFGLQAVKLYGGMPDAEKEHSVTRFQVDDTCRLFIGSIRAAGVGITLTASSNVVFAELDWTPANMMQAEDRCHRIGQTESVLVQHLVFDGSLDAKMAETLVHKMEIIGAALDETDL